MGFLDYFWKKPVVRNGVKLSKAEIAEQLRQSCWDLYISNLPKPKIFNTAEDENIPDEFKNGVPSGFSIDPETWVVYFNADDLPVFTNPDEAKQYCRSTGQHENMHFINCPGSKRMQVRLVDRALKGLSGKILDDKEAANAVAHIVVNIFGDWNGDYLLGADKFGREDFNAITRERLRKTVEHVASQTKAYSPLWKVLVGTYERLFKQDLDLSKYTQLSRSEERTVEDCVQIMGDDFRDKEVWPDKVERLAKTLEDVLLNSNDKNRKKSFMDHLKKKKQQGGGYSLPSDVKKQMGPKAGENKIKTGKKIEQTGEEKTSGEGEGTEQPTPQPVDDETLDEIYKLNKDNPGQFAGTLSAFNPVEADEALRLMYRMRAREYLIKINEKKNIGSYATPGSYRTWDVGDPILGRGGLEIVPSIAGTGLIIPGITSLKRERQVSNIPGRLKQVADLFLVIDSSGSMDWYPMESNDEDRGSFDKAIVAAEAAAMYSIDHGGKVAVLNHSGRGQVRYQDFTSDLSKIEKAVVYHYNDGTSFPVSDYDGIMRRNKTRVVACGISDFQVENPDDAAQIIFKYANRQNPFYMFDIGNGQEALTQRLIGHEGIVRFPITKMNDLNDVVIGKLREDYKRPKELTQVSDLAGK